MLVEESNREIPILTDVYDRLLLIEGQVRYKVPFLTISLSFFYNVIIETSVHFSILATPFTHIVYFILLFWVDFYIVELHFN